MKTSLTKLTVGAAVAVIACAPQQSPNNRIARTNIPPGTGLSNTDTGTGAGAGMWMDSTGGAWMEGDGTIYMGGRGGRMMGLQAADIRSMTDANIVSHLAAGDSLEIALSQQGASSAQNPAVRDFANRMVQEHTAHLQQGRQLASQAGITPMPSPADTADAMMANRMMMRLASNQSGSSDNNNASYDRRLMRAEVMMHQHMLHELTMLQPQASGATRQLIDQTIPTVRQHLTLAQSVWRQVGGGMDDR
ncbi:MAG TPA: DUF4142 domain-containing protein [Gemmatimonadaceae bacterium]